MYIDVEHSLQLHIIETETVLKTVSKLATAVADATVIVVIAAAVDASRCHASHNNATETNYYDSNEETILESMSTYSDEYNNIIMRTTSVMLLILNTLCTLWRYYMSKSAVGHWLHDL